MQILIKIRVCDCTVVARTSFDCCNSVRYVSEIIRTNCRKIIKLPNDLFIFATCCVIVFTLAVNYYADRACRKRIETVQCPSGGFRGVRPHPLGVLQKNSGSTDFENSEDSRQHDY